MDIIFEALLDLIIDGSIELGKNRKVPKLIRYPLIALIVLFFAGVILGFIILRIMELDKNILIGLICIILAIIFLIFSIKNFRKTF